MNSTYLYEYVDSFEKVLSIAYITHYSLDAVERLVSYSSFFQRIEKDYNGSAPIISNKALSKSLFPELDINIEDIPVHNQCLWAAEAYLKIQQTCKLTFEAIFLYCPIKKMFAYFDLYHEMDFSQIINEFNNLYEGQSAFSLLLKKFHYSLNYISEQTGLSYNTLYSLKSRRRDIKKMNIESLIAIANVFNVRLETLAEIKLQK